MPRLIDKEPNARTKPMRILGVGLCRTGTSSMRIALNKLGYTPYHGSESFKNPPRDFNLWIEAMRCNFLDADKTSRYGREEFDRLMGSYDACLDVPACLFWDDFHRAYPDAKVILTTRDADSWLDSVNVTILKFIRMRFFQLWQYVDITRSGPLFQQLKLVWEVLCDGSYDREKCRQAYLEHNQRIRDTIPASQLLEFRLGVDGWEELCQFLDLPVPREPWPKAYPKEAYQEHISLALHQAIRQILLSLGLLSVLVIAILFAK
ncbi:sulfotransferase family protein [Aspergillus affinis]|uniref:sulfotransferase family protein n=1 Tax=Aspergillus affinis TaxID=1070780 RepID=UPI0022FF16D5|nr:uncharacterized protein KD926_002175 [Aspergillus affinis]KAI9036207.1 hypothetical protein KD926_002175 [Aspergillus affinis]